MKVTASTALIAASAALAQGIDPTSAGASVLSSLSPQCLGAVVSLVQNQNLSQCLDFQGLAAIVTSNTSIIPPIDEYLSTLCSSEPCSNATLAAVAGTIASGCSSDLSSYGISNTTVYDVVAQYPLARDVLCLKTTAPAAANFTNASIPITSSEYNSTNGTFCVTSLLTESSAYWGVDLTVDFLVNVTTGNNQTALDLAKSVPPESLCQDCIYAAVDLIQEQFPQLENRPISYGGFNGTIDSFLNATCANTDAGFVPTTNGTLPPTISQSAQDSEDELAGANSTVPIGNSTTTASRKRVLLGREATRL